MKRVTYLKTLNSNFYQLTEFMAVIRFRPKAAITLDLLERCPFWNGSYFETAPVFEWYPFSNSLELYRTWNDTHRRTIPNLERYALRTGAKFGTVPSLERYPI